MKNLTPSDNEGFQKVCSIKDLSDNCGKRFMVDEPGGSGLVVDLAIFKMDKKIYALSNVCPHQHTSLIYDGFLEENCVVCPVHGWMFDLSTGKTSSGGKGLNVYETKVIDDQVYVKVSNKNWDW